MNDKQQRTQLRSSRFRFARWLKPKVISEWTNLWKEKGFRGFLKEKGWKVVIAIFLFYLIRDVFLYIVLPVWAARGFFGC